MDNNVIRDVNYFIRKDDKFSFEFQKFLDLASNIEDEDLRTRIIVQFIKCQNKIINLIDEKLV